VITGAMSDNEIVIKRGLSRGDKVLLSVPTNAAALQVVRLPEDKTRSPAQKASPAKS
jgi:hypothetical protein